MGSNSHKNQEYVLTECTLHCQQLPWLPAHARSPVQELAAGAVLRDSAGGGALAQDNSPHTFIVGPGYGQPTSTYSPPNKPFRLLPRTHSSSSIQHKPEYSMKKNEQASHLS